MLDTVVNYIIEHPFTSALTMHACMTLVVAVMATEEWLYNKKHAA